MKHICAWCNTILGIDGDDDSPTHTICHHCRNNLDFQLGADLLTYLDSLSTPVIVVTGDAEVVVVNFTAAALLGHPSSELHNQRLGDVFECARARFPEGCGRTIHCSGCAIRRAVTDTAATGASHHRQPAILRQYRDDPEITLYITTEQVGDFVVLQVERVEEKDMVVA